MGKGILNYDAATINNLLKTLRENKNVFPFDTSPTAGSEKGITSGAVEEALKDVSSKMKGYFLTEEDLRKSYPETDEGSKAYVGNNYPYAIYLYEKDKGGWYDTKQTGGEETFNAGEFYTKIQIDSFISNIYDTVDTMGNRIDKISGQIGQIGNVLDVINEEKL